MVCTITTSRPCTCVFLPLHTFVISLLFPRFETKRKTAIQTIIHQHMRKHIIVINTQNNIRFLNSITHTCMYINPIDYHYCIGRQYRKAKQRVSSHLNTNSRLLTFRKFKNTNSLHYNTYIITDKFSGVFSK